MQSANEYSRTSLVRTTGDRQNVFALSGIRINQFICNEKALKGTGIVFVFVLTGISY